MSEGGKKRTKVEKITKKAHWKKKRNPYYREKTAATAATLKRGRSRRRATPGEGKKSEKEKKPRYVAYSTTCPV